MSPGVFIGRLLGVGRQFQTRIAGPESRPGPQKEPQRYESHRQSALRVQIVREKKQLSNNLEIRWEITGVDTMQVQSAACTIRDPWEFQAFFAVVLK